MDNEKTLAQAKRTLTIEYEAIAAAAERLNSDFLKAVEMLLNNPGRAILCGMGKSGAVGRKLAATFASTGTPAFFMHPAEALHGDLGMMTDDDIVIMLSNSGETDEINAILPAIKRRGVPIIAVCGDENSTLAHEAMAIVNSAIECEACPLGLAPTASTTTMMALGDALAMAVMYARGFSAEEFAASHPGGKLGRRLLSRVADAMHYGDENPTVSPEETVLNCLLKMSDASVRGVVSVVDDTGILVGFFTDGDFRRIMHSGKWQRDEIMDLPVSEVMTRNPITVKAETMATEALHTMETKRVDNLPVIDDEGVAIGVVDIQDLVRLRIV